MGNRSIRHLNHLYVYPTTRSRISAFYTAHELKMPLGAIAYMPQSKIVLRGGATSEAHVLIFATVESPVDLEIFRGFELHSLTNCGVRQEYYDCLLPQLRPNTQRARHERKRIGRALAEAAREV